jgi:hypothetical protein
MRRAALPINSNAVSAASYTELFCRIAGNYFRLRQKAQHFQAWPNFMLRRTNNR